LCESHHFHESQSAGPNGHAIWSSHLDAYEIGADGKISENVNGLAAAIGFTKLTERLKNVLWIFSTFDTGSEG